MYEVGETGMFQEIEGIYGFQGKGKWIVFVGFDPSLVVVYFFDEGNVFAGFVIQFLFGFSVVF